MTLQAPRTASSVLGTFERSVPRTPPVPQYLQQVYWWAYVHPRAVQFFEREWLVNLILFGNYTKLRDAALESLGPQLTGRTLQIACVYGTLTPCLRQQLAPDARLDVVDIVPAQLKNLARKLPADDKRVTLVQCDSSSLSMPDASYDQVLLFFLLHEQPEPVRRATMAEAVRVCKPGGRIVIVEYDKPVPYHPLRPLIRLVFDKLEPFAIDLWKQDVTEFFPENNRPKLLSKTRYYGGLYQRLVLER